MQSGRSADDPLVSRAEIARLAGVTRPAVTNWERRHGDFPEPVRSGDMEYFHLAQIVTWLKSRTIPASARAADEPAGATYADRVRRNRGTAVPQSQGASADDVGSLDDTKTRQLLDELMGPLADGVRGAGSMADYLNLLFSLALLRGCAPDQWSALPGEGQPTAGHEDAKELLQRIGSSADEVLRRSGLLPGMYSSLLRLQPRTYRHVAHVVRLSGILGRNAFPLLLDQYETHIGLKSAEFFTPHSLTQLMAHILLSETSPPRRIYDPYVRGGELLAAVAAAGNDLLPRTTRPVVHGEGPHRDTLRLAGINLAIHGLPARIETSSPTPWNEADWPRHRADLILTNPPFNVSGLPTRSRKDKEWPYGPPPPGNDNFAWLQHILASLNEGGRAAVVMPNNAAVSTNQQERAIRREMLERGAVDCVIALPPQLFTRTPIPVSLWLLKYPAGSCDQVLLIDAGRMGVKSRSQRVLTEQDRNAIENAYRSWQTDREHGLNHPGTDGLSTSVDATHIRDQDYSLNPADYVLRTTQTARTTATRALTDICEEESRLRARVRDTDARVDSLRFSPLPGLRDPLPVGWKQMPLHALCKIQAGPSYSRMGAETRSADGAVPVVLPKHISNRRIVAIDHDKVSREVAEKLQKFWLKSGDILCVRSGTTGQSARVEKSQARWLFSTNLLRLHQFDPDVINPDYLLGYLSLPDVIKWIKIRSRATTAIPSISAAALGQLSITLPPLAEQRRIGAVLNAFDEQIAAHLDLAQAAERTRATLAEHLLEGALAVE